MAATPGTVVLGAGYAGLMTARSVAREAPVTLVNERPFFVERVRLHQVAAGQRRRELPLAELAPELEVVVARVTGIDLAARTVSLSDGRALPYRTLVYALGSGTDLSAPGAAEHALDVGGLAGAERVRDLPAGSSVAVVGGGLTGIETAAELAEAGHKAVLVAPVVGEGLSAKGRAYVEAALVRLGAEVAHERTVEVRADGVVLASGALLPADAVVWTAGFRVPPLAAAAGLAVDARGRVSVDATLRSTSHPDVYAVGDAAAARTEDGQELRMACATGLPMGQHAARAITDRMAGREPRPLRYRYVNQCVSLGRTDALVQFTGRDDSPRERVLRGRLAALYKEAIVKGTVFAERHPRTPVSL